MRENVIKYSGILKWFLIIGCLIIFFGLTYFLGIFEIDFEYSLLGVPINSFYGITYVTLFTFGFYLITFALLLILPSLDKNNRNKLINIHKIFISFGVLGLALILYSFTIHVDILPPLAPFHKWFDYFILGIIILFSNYLIVILSTENIQSLSNYNRVWLLLISIGIAIEILSLLTYWSLFLTIQVAPRSWGDLYFLGLVCLFIGGLPFLVSYQPTNPRISLVLGILSLILIVSGIFTYLAPTLALNGVLIPMSIFKYNRYFDYLFYGSLLLILGVSIASFNQESQKYLRRYPIIWISLLILGFVQYILSILMEITDTHFIDLGLDFLFLQNPHGSLLFGMTWNVFLFNSLITTFFALIILSSLILKETKLAEEKQKIEEINKA
ncbi:MAG: hypothetical protein ACW97Z_16685 [Candidatus Hodarchaeales archaeon]